MLITYVPHTAPVARPMILSKTSEPARLSIAARIANQMDAIVALTGVGVLLITLTLAHH